MSVLTISDLEYHDSLPFTITIEMIASLKTDSLTILGLISRNILSTFYSFCSGPFETRMGLTVWNSHQILNPIETYSNRSKDSNPQSFLSS